jgi:hypothetical protein
MSNILDSGAVLPFGLLGANSAQDLVVGFNRSYKNTALKAGIVIASYAADDPFNKTGLCTEYDVQAIEQFEDKGTTSQIYRNCLSTQGFGSIPDYFEYNLRSKTLQANKGTPSFKGQNGAVALLQCLDGIGEKALVVGYLIHPDRPTKIEDTNPQLFGEYNGVAVQVNTDGSTSLTFKGSTDNDGEQNDSSQGNTVVNIATDGSFSVSHSTITMNLARSGVVTLTATGDINISNNGKTNITSQGDVSITTQGNSNVTAQGDANITATGKVVVTGSEIDLDGDQAHVLTDVSQPVIDSIFGEISVGFSLVKTGI